MNLSIIEDDSTFIPNQDFIRDSFKMFQKGIWQVSMNCVSNIFYGWEIRLHVDCFSPIYHDINNLRT